MTTSSFRHALRGLALAAAFAAVAPPLRAQVTVDDRVNQLAENVKKKKDDEAATVIDGIAKNFATFSEEDKKKVTAAVEKCLAANRGDDDNKLFEAVFVAFMNMGELGEKATVRGLGSPSVAKRKGVLSGALRSLGSHKDPANTKTISDMLKNSEPLVVAGAADGLAFYADQPEKIRRPIVEELVKAYATYGSAATSGQADNKQKGQAKDKLAIVESPLREALKKMTNQEFKDYSAAQKWYNDNKGKKWDEPSKN
ncbi:MAG TPA: hypothetical protein VFG37_04375 [Planctomycetota bacterium]|nr:hypothetical protein [Planctomycetota bacterium]